MGVTLDLPLTVQLLGSGEVVSLGVGEESSLHVLDVHLDGEGGIGPDRTKVLRELELGRRHVVDRGDSTNGSRVAGPSGDLFSIGNGSVDGQAEVDEVVR